MSSDLPPAPPGYTAKESDGAFNSILPPNPYSQEAVQATPLEQLNEKPETVFCPFCRRIAKTRVGNGHPHAIRAVRAVWNSFWLIATAGPDMFDWLRNRNHYCSSCGKQLTREVYHGAILTTPEAREAQLMTVDHFQSLR